MRFSVALFTADLRVHDNPVRQAALKDAERVVPLFVVDTGIRRTGFTGPNRAALLADSLADLDAALRARGGRLVVRVEEPADHVGGRFRLGREDGVLAQSGGPAAVRIARPRARDVQLTVHRACPRRQA